MQLLYFTGIFGADYDFCLVIHTSYLNGNIFCYGCIWNSDNDPFCR